MSALFFVFWLQRVGELLCDFFYSSAFLKVKGSKHYLTCQAAERTLRASSTLGHSWGKTRLEVVGWFSALTTTSNQHSVFFCELD
jgi:hypothetical protein